MCESFNNPKCRLCQMEVRLGILGFVNHQDMRKT